MRRTTVTATQRPPRKGRPPRIGLALAGGGPLGAIYEIETGLVRYLPPDERI